MRYIIMCGGEYAAWKSPRHLVEIHGEPIVARTIRLLQENNIRDIAISSNHPAFSNLGVPVLKHDNNYRAKKGDDLGYWFEAFYPTDEPTCYLFGDVVYSPEAIRKIIETDTDDIEFFGSAPPYDERYIKLWPEPFAFKVVNTDHLKQAIIDCRKYADLGYFWRRPIAWELWTVIKNGELQKKRPDAYKRNYTVINDYTCDVDSKEDIDLLEAAMEGRI